MRKFLITLIILTAGLTFIPLDAEADGGVFPPPYYHIQESGQKAVIFYERGKETLILSIAFRGDAKDFGWVIPVPQKPEVTKGSDEIFTSIQEIIQKHLKYRNIAETFTAPMMGLGGGAEPVTMIETKKIDYYDVAVLSATDSQALARWLSDNGYQYPEESAYILDDYINNQWYFVAVKISPEAAGASEVIEGLKEGHTTPLKIVFDTQAIIYPLRISAIEVGAVLVKLSDNLALNQEKIKHLKNIGYDELADKEKGPAIFNQIVRDILNKKPYAESKAGAYPLIISEDNYSQGRACYSLRDCQWVAEDWFNNYFASQGLYHYGYQQNFVPIYLYVIADGKKEIPGFSVNYANWISAKDIRELAYDANGRPLINPQGGKYYLTAFFRTMTTQEMTNDLVIRAAKDNQRVNAPNPWLNFLGGVLVALGIVFFWTFSPLGLIFIAGLLLAVLTKPKAPRTLGRVFQALSFLITLGFFILFLILSLKLSYPFAVNIWMIGLTCGLGLIVAGQIIAGFWQWKLAGESRQKGKI